MKSIKKVMIEEALDSAEMAWARLENMEQGAVQLGLYELSKRIRQVIGDVRKVRDILGNELRNEYEEH